MINIFRFLYWSVAVLLLLSTTAIWIFLMVKQDAIVAGCQQYLTEMTSNASPYYTPVNLPNGSSLHKDDCVTANRQLLIVSGIIVFVGNFIQASIISLYSIIKLIIGFNRFILLRLLMLMLVDSRQV
jgi:hypothetical protein